MNEKIIKIVGKENGPTSIILAGIHGNEKSGIKALVEILPNLKIERGIVFVGYGNPRAIKANKRYIEADLNRVFVDENLLSKKEKKSYEYERAQFLKIYLDKADALLDIHASSITDSKPFLICESNANDLVKFLPTKLVVSGFDKVEPGGTDYYMNKNNKIGICLESGYLDEPNSIKIAKENIFAFLKARGHLTNDLKPTQQSYIRMYKKYFTKTDNFTLSKKFRNFETTDKNQIIGIDGQEKIKVSKKSIILFAHNCNKTNSEAFLLGEKKDLV